MDDKQKKSLWFIAALVLLAVLFWWKSRAAPAPIIIPQETAPENPFDWPNGIYPGGENMWGGSPFDSTINVNVSGPGMGWLSSQYMPAFGLVGVTAVRG